MQDICSHGELDRIFTPDCVHSLHGSPPKSTALHQLVQFLAERGRIANDKANILSDALIIREELGTTGLGKGLAIPHLRSHHVDQFVGAIGVAHEGLDFDSLDGLPTRLIILLVSPFAERETHCSIMGKIASLLSDQTLQYSLQIQRSPEALLSYLGFR